MKVPHECATCGDDWGLAEETFVFSRDGIEYEAHIILCTVCRDQIEEPDSIEDIRRQVGDGR